MKSTQTISIDVLEGKELELKELIEQFSDTRMREWLFETPDEISRVLKLILDCLPAENKRRGLGWGLTVGKYYSDKAKEVLPEIKTYFKEQKVKFKYPNYLENFLPFVSQYLSLNKRFYSYDYINQYYPENKLRNGFIKSIYNFLMFIIEGEINDAQLRRLTAKICQLLKVIDEDDGEEEAMNKVKNANNTTAKDIYHDQLIKSKDLTIIIEQFRKLGIEFVDPADPYGYHSFQIPTRLIHDSKVG